MSCLLSTCAPLFLLFPFVLFIACRFFNRNRCLQRFSQRIYFLHLFATDIIMKLFIHFSSRSPPVTHRNLFSELSLLSKANWEKPAVLFPFARNFAVFRLITFLLAVLWIVEISVALKCFRLRPASRFFLSVDVVYLESAGLLGSFLKGLNFIPRGRLLPSVLHPYAELILHWKRFVFNRLPRFCFSSVNYRACGGICLGKWKLAKVIP